MKRFRLLAALFAGVFFYSVFSIFAGRDGIWVRNQLNEQKRVLSTHTASIEKTNRELLLEKTALQKDEDVIRAYARKMGYVSEGEKLVKIIGLPVRETHLYDAGSIIKHTDVNYIDESVCKMLGLIIFSLVYIVLILADFSRGIIRLPQASRRLKLTEGSVVYDLQ